ncbi:MAG: DUF1638 domain-containing protein [Anaerolineales bacterium]|uniref:DUF1638 domain-containing protein n=1 Tax=Promineifilum sp. TaxID=2664178 RepID=UPI001DD94747|nr:DUF1638 domain-containing protein [Anaerolineales bacterium]MCB8934914.1 DUF1638 domain-containing protein [Promineifilum sp.]MCO5178483.1 DUF1638 domain-containing protein [Promineifilum sp.]
MSLAFIICGALAREVLAIIRQNDWEIDVYGIPAIDHMRPEKIAPDVERKLLAIRERYTHVLVVYGDCGTRGSLDELLDRYDLQRLESPHCYEMYGGARFDELMAEEPGTFFLTDFLVRGFQGTIWHGLGLDRFPQLKNDYFHNYRRIVYMMQTDSLALRDKAAEIAKILELPLEIRFSGYGLLEKRLSDWVQQHDR